MSQFNAPAYDIQRPTGVCAFTGRTIEPGESYTATLVEVDQADAESGKADNGGLKRIDVSADAWDKGLRPDDLFCFWRATVPEPAEKKKLFVDDDVLMNLFRRLEDTDRPDRLAFRFVLTLILMRKRLLKYTRSEQRPDDAGNQQEWWTMRGKSIEGAEPEMFDVLNPGLDEQQLQHVTEQLGEILEAEL